jgi:hypothetical protein
MSTEIHETVALQDIFVSGTGLIEDIGGGCVRLYLTTRAPVCTPGEKLESILVAKIVMPREALPELIAHTTAAMKNQRGGILTTQSAADGVPLN